MSLISDRRGRVLPVGLVIVCSIVALSAEVRINEFMASNGSYADDPSGVTDDAHDSSDWIELYNGGGSDVDLTGWALTDDPLREDLWRFPRGASIPAQGYLVVFASGKDRKRDPTLLHTDFSLDRRDGSLALLGPDDALVDGLDHYPEQVEDVSFGRGASGDWVYFVDDTQAEPTRGTANADRQTGGPLLADLQPLGGVIASGSELLVQVRATGASRVEVHYRVGLSEEVIRRMRDDGSNGDLVAGDEIYSRRITDAGGAAVGEILRWRVTAEGSGGEARAPTWFAALDHSPQYYGALIRDDTGSDPVDLHFLLEDPDGADKRSGTRGVVVIGDDCFDNVFVRQRGGFSAQGSRKIEFNAGYHYRLIDGEPKVDEINLNTRGRDYSYMRRLLSWEVMRLAGMPYCAAVPMRVYENGSFVDLRIAIEQPDPDYLRRHELPDSGALYKMKEETNGTPADADDELIGKKNREWESPGGDPRGDLKAFIAAIQPDVPLADRADDLFDQVNIAAVINYMAAMVIMAETDHPHKNYYLFRDTEGTREWRMLAWDKDLPFGLRWPDWDESDNYDPDGDHNRYNHPFYADADHKKQDGKWNYLIHAIIEHPRTQAQFLRRLRTLMDDILQDDTSGAGYLDQRIAALEAWLKPALPGGKAGKLSKAAIGLGQVNSNSEDDGDGLGFLGERRQYLFEEHADDGSAAPSEDFAGIPTPQPGAPAVVLGALEVLPASGTQADEYVELINNEDVAVDCSGWRVSGEIAWTLPPGTVISANSSLYLSPDAVSFRARYGRFTAGQRNHVQGNYRGQLSARGGVVRLRDSSDAIVDETTYPGTPTQAQQAIRITEIHYHPADDLAEEFIEIKNVGSSSVDLSAASIDDAVAFTFPDGSVLAAGGFFVLAADAAAFATRHPGVDLLGTYLGSLDDGGERLTLRDPVGEVISRVRYNDRSPWPLAADGAGHSLVPTLVDPVAEQDDPLLWRVSAAMHGSPGADDPEPAPVAAIRVNEVLTHTDWPLVDAVELHNPGSEAAEIGGWWLTDDGNTPQKYQIPVGTSIAAGEYLVIAEDNDGDPLNDSTAGEPAYFGNDFSLSSQGEELWLFGPGLQTVDGVDFDAAANGVSFGRYAISTGAIHFPPQKELSMTLDPAVTAISPGAANAGPLVGPVVITEIHYHPAVSGEFVELQNISGDTVPLYDPSNPANTWRLDGIDFDFPADISLAPGEVLLLVGDDTPADFRAAHGLPAALQILAYSDGRLDNGGERLRLQQPDVPDLAVVPMVTVDAVDYDDAAPWPTPPDGTGPSLERVAPQSYGDDPANWQASAADGGSPGVVASGPTRTLTVSVRLGGGTKHSTVGVRQGGALLYEARTDVHIVPLLQPGLDTAVEWLSDLLGDG